MLPRCPRVVRDARPPGGPRSRPPPRGRLLAHAWIDVHHLASRHDPPRCPCFPSHHHPDMPERRTSLGRTEVKRSVSPAGLCEGAPASAGGTVWGKTRWTGLSTPPYVFARILVSSSPSTISPHGHGRPVAWRQTSRTGRRGARREMAQPTLHKEAICPHDTVWNSDCMMPGDTGNI